MSFTHVGSVTSSSNLAPAQTFNASLTSVSAGNLIVVFVWLISEGPATPSVTDDKGNTYLPAGGLRAGGIGEAVGMFYIRTPSSGTHVITVDKNSTAYGARFVAVHWTGPIASGTVLDVAGTAATSSVNLTTTVDNALLVGIASSNVGAPGAGSGFTQIASPNEQWYSSCERKEDAGTAGAKTVTFSYAACMTAAAFKPVAGAGGGGVSPSLALTSVTPTDGFVNSVQHVTLVGSALTAGVLTISGSNVTVSGTAITGGGTQLDADLTIASGAAVGARTLTVTTTDGTATITFTVRSRTAGTGTAIGGVSAFGTPFLTAEIVH